MSRKLSWNIEGANGATSLLTVLGAARVRCGRWPVETGIYHAARIPCYDITAKQRLLILSKGIYSITVRQGIFLTRHLALPTSATRVRAKGTPECKRSQGSPRLHDPYWADLATLLAIHPNGKNKVTGEVIQRLKRRLHSDVYATYINRRFGWSTTERKQLTLIDTKGFIQKGVQ